MEGFEVTLYDPDFISKRSNILLKNGKYSVKVEGGRIIEVEEVKVTLHVGILNKQLAGSSK